MSEGDIHAFVNKCCNATFASFADDVFKEQCEELASNPEKRELYRQMTSEFAEIPPSYSIDTLYPSRELPMTMAELNEIELAAFKKLSGPPAGIPMTLNNMLNDISEKIATGVIKIHHEDLD